MKELSKKVESALLKSNRIPVITNDYAVGSLYNK